MGCMQVPTFVSVLVLLNLHRCKARMFPASATLRGGSCRALRLLSFRPISTGPPLLRTRAPTLPPFLPTSACPTRPIGGLLHTSCYHLECPESREAISFPSGPAFMVLAGTSGEDWANTIGQTGAYAMPNTEIATSDASEAEVQWLQSRGIDRVKLPYGQYNRHYYSARHAIKLLNFETMPEAFDWATRTVEALKARSDDVAQLECSADWLFLQTEVAKEDFSEERWLVGEFRIPCARLITNLVHAVVRMSSSELEAASAVIPPANVERILDCSGDSGDDEGSAALTTPSAAVFNPCDDIVGMSVGFRSEEEIVLFNPSDVLLTDRVVKVTIGSQLWDLFT